MADYCTPKWSLFQNDCYLGVDNAHWVVCSKTGIMVMDKVIMSNGHFGNGHLDDESTVILIIEITAILVIQKSCWCRTTIFYGHFGLAFCCKIQTVTDHKNGPGIAALTVTVHRNLDLH